MFQNKSVFIKEGTYQNSKGVFKGIKSFINMSDSICEIEIDNSIKIINSSNFIFLDENIQGAWENNESTIEIENEQ